MGAGRALESVDETGEGEMVSKTTILTRHDVTAESSDLTASMMLDDTGAGYVMVSTTAGPSFSMDAGKLAEMLQLLAECESIRVFLAEGPVLAGADRP